MPETLTCKTKTAPGKISVTADEWTNEVTKTGYIGMTAHWIDVRDGKWELRGEAVGLRAILGDHGGDNLGRYIIGLCDCVRICSKQDSKVQCTGHAKKRLVDPIIWQLYTITLDNTSSNNTKCQTVETVHKLHKYNGLWDAMENQLP